ncbi:unnamed protein product [Ectocarpus sp. CCAP 1310/34]|nr:unnamed protein product [Ectocarpus sp. CCAP 1310/34]
MTDDGKSTTSTQSIRTILQGSDGAIFDLLCAGASNQQWTEWLRTPVEYAVAAGNLDLVVKLAQAGQAGARNSAMPSAVRRGHDAEPDERGNTPLHIAASLGHDAINALLLLQKAAVNSLDGEDRTPLHLAAGKDSLAGVKALVSAHADLRLRFGDADESPMDCAACFGYVDMMLTLTQHGVGVNDAAATGMTPLHIAAGQAQLPAIDALVEAEANVGAEEYGTGGTPLHLATGSASVDAVACLLRHGADANKLNGDRLSALHLAAKDGAADMTSLTALHMAISNKDTGVIDALVEAGAEVDAQGGETCETPLHLATKLGSSDAVAILLTHDADPKSTAIIQALVAEGAQPSLSEGINGMTSLALAAARRHGEAAASLVLHRPSANAQDDRRRTALHCAASNDNVAVIDVLAAAGAKIGAKDKRGWTPLHFASSGGCIEAVAALMKHGSDGNIVNFDCYSPLHLAVCKGDCAAVTAVLVGGADLEAEAAHGGTPVHNALQWGCSEVVLALLKHGAHPTKRMANGRGGRHAAVGENIDLRDYEGSTALHLVGGDSAEVVEILLQHGAEVESRDMDDRTPLHKVAMTYNKRYTSIDALVDGGAAIETPDNFGRTILHLASSKHRCAAMKALLRKGVDVLAKDNDGRSPLHLAVSYETSKDTVEYEDVEDEPYVGRTPVDVWRALAEMNYAWASSAAPIRRLLVGAQKDRTWR